MQARARTSPAWLVASVALALLAVAEARAFAPEEPVLRQKLAEVEGSAETLGRPSRQRTTSRRDAIERAPYLERALILRTRLEGEWSLGVARVLRLQGEDAWALGDREEAHRLLGRAHEIFKGLKGSDDPETIAVAGQLAESFRRRNFATRATYRLREAWHATNDATGPYDPEDVPSFQAREAERIGTVYYRRGSYARAAPLFRRALKIWTRMLGPEHPRVLRTRWRLAKIAQKVTALPEDPPNNLVWMQRCTRLYNLKNGPMQREVDVSGLLDGWDPEEKRPH